MKLCVIPARGGSKRIAHKNIKAFCGKPIIAYSIQAALQSACFDKVIVSTDDPDIQQIALEQQAEVPFMRPPELANDYVGTMPVVKHAIEWFSDNDMVPTEVCCLYATAPFVKASTIAQAYQLLISLSADYCFTVTSYAYPIQRALMITKEQKVQMFHPENFNVRSQDLQESFHDAAQFYWGTAEAFVHQRPLFSENATPFVLPRHLVQDIDTPEDWTRAEFLYRLLLEAGEIQ